jgi:hypothetical protein
MTCGDLRPAELNQPNDEGVCRPSRDDGGSMSTEIHPIGWHHDQKIEGGFHAALID